MCYAVSDITANAAVAVKDALQNAMTAVFLPYQCGKGRNSMGICFIIGIAVIGCILAVVGYFRRLRRSESCCGTQSAAPPKVKVADRNKRNYPHSTLITIDGMTCANCARHVENALNSLAGTYAIVDLGARCAKVYFKSPYDEAQIRRVVRACGYTVLKLRGY